MDEENKQLTIQDSEEDTSYEEALDHTPEEVRTYLWSDEYKHDILTVFGDTTITPDQQHIFQSVIFDMLIGVIKHKNDTIVILTSAGISTDVQESVFAKVGAIILPKVLERMDIYSEYDYDDTSDITSDTYVPENSPAAIIASIQQKLAQPKVVMPMKRLSGMDIQQPSQEVHTDPYREIPGK